jgi:transcriptional regulator with XRE-family HTH domain
METINVEDSKNKMSMVNRYVQSLCGLYSRVARQLKVDRSYVSRVARGERNSPEVAQAISTEFDRIMTNDEGKAA